MALNLSLNRVSDDNYWRDFHPQFDGSLTQRLLANDATLNWSQMVYFHHSVRTLKWQTLQDVTAPIVPPYDRLPQLATPICAQQRSGMICRWTRITPSLSLTASSTGQPNAQRDVLSAAGKPPIAGTAGFVTPSCNCMPATTSLMHPCQMVTFGQTARGAHGQHGHRAGV
jgi:LPS-assembly protein